MNKKQRKNHEEFSIEIRQLLAKELSNVCCLALKSMEIPTPANENYYTICDAESDLQSSQGEEPGQQAVAEQQMRQVLHNFNKNNDGGDDKYNFNDNFDDDLPENAVRVGRRIIAKNNESGSQAVTISRCTGLERLPRIRSYNGEDRENKLCSEERDRWDNWDKRSNFKTNKYNDDDINGGNRKSNCGINTTLKSIKRGKIVAEYRDKSGRWRRHFSHKIGQIGEHYDHVDNRDSILRMLPNGSVVEIIPYRFQASDCGEFGVKRDLIDTPAPIPKWILEATVPYPNSPSPAENSGEKSVEKCTGQGASNKFITESSHSDCYNLHNERLNSSCGDSIYNGKLSDGGDVKFSDRGDVERCSGEKYGNESNIHNGKLSNGGIHYNGNDGGISGGSSVHNERLSSDAGATARNRIRRAPSSSRSEAQRRMQNRAAIDIVAKLTPLVNSLLATPLNLTTAVLVSRLESMVRRSEQLAKKEAKSGGGSGGGDGRCGGCGVDNSSGECGGCGGSGGSGGGGNRVGDGGLKCQYNRNIRSISSEDIAMAEDYICRYKKDGNQDVAPLIVVEGRR